MRKIDTSRVKQQGDHLQSQDGKKEFPNLHDFFSAAFFTGGENIESREPGTLFVMVRDGHLQCILKEPSQGLVLRLEAASLKALMSTLEVALGADGSMWEKDQYASQRGKKGSRKGS